MVLDHGVLLREQLLLLLDEFVSLRQLVPQNLILFSQIDQFFFDRHALTLLGLTPFGKSPAHLGSYQNSSYDVEGADVRRLFIERSSIIREPIVGIIDFTHRTFQEFLAALAILDEKDISMLVQNAHNDQWLASET